MADITSKVEVVWCNPRPEEQWRCYIGGVIKVRELNNGDVQVATGLDEWRAV